MRFIRELIKGYPALLYVVLAMIAAGLLDVTGYDQFAHIILGTVSLIMVVPLLWGMYQTLRDGEFGVDLLAATAIVTSVIMGEYWAGMIIVLMLTGGEALEDYSEERAKRELTSLISNTPRIAHVIKGRSIVDVRVVEVSPGQTIEIRPGEMVPVDGVIIDGTSTFDESSITGESLPVERTTGHEILSGSVNGDNAIRIKVLKSSEDSQYQQIVELVKQAQKTKAPFVKMADRYAVPFTILSFTIAISAWVISGDSLRFLQVLVVATPCPLILAAPIAIISGMSRAAKHGIIVKSGQALERLASARAVAFDKTGTLTKGQIRVEKVKSTSSEYTDNDVLKLAASIERSSNHVIAAAIAQAAKDKKLKLKKATGVSESTGFGVTGIVGRLQVVIGKLAFLQSHSVINATKSPVKANQTAVYVAVDGKLIGYILFADEVRKESKATINSLESLGIRHVMMITGDNQTTALSIAQKVGISEVHADCLPAEKLRIVKEVDAHHKPIAFVGDGVNDAPVLSAADVGVAIGARGSSAASESADVVIMLDDLSKFAQGLSIAKRSISIGRQSILLGIFISVGLMLVFSTGKFSPVYGAAIQELVDIIVIVNALRAHYG